MPSYHMNLTREEHALVMTHRYGPRQVRKVVRATKPERRAQRIIRIEGAVARTFWLSFLAFELFVCAKLWWMFHR